MSGKRVEKEKRMRKKMLNKNKWKVQLVYVAESEMDMCLSAL